MKKIIFLFCVIFLFYSCKRKEILMSIKFGLTENQIKSEAVKLSNDDDLTMEIKDDDTTFYRNLKIDGATYKCLIYFNPDNLETGPLRSYEYDLATLPYTKTGNDTLGNAGQFKLTNWNVFKVSDFENLKSSLDKKYGNGFFSTSKDNFWNDTIYEYQTESANLFLKHGGRVIGTYWGVPIKVPFYGTAGLEIRSKSYSDDLKKEYEKRRKELKPEDVLRIDFTPPYFTTDYNEYGDNFLKLVVKAYFDSYTTNVINNDIIECKGILLMTDAYNDTLAESEIIYKFPYPLISPRKQRERLVKYNYYTLNSADPSYYKIADLVRSGSKIKIEFKPTAVVLDDGSVIK
jgi:hypothetical protein